MKKKTLVTMPGDGIGKIVLGEALRVLQAVGFRGEYLHADVGWEFWVNEGNPLPDRTVELLAEHKLALFGSITSKGKAQAAEELSPKLRDTGLSYFSPIVKMRQLFDLDICIRPCRSFSGNPLNFVRRDGQSFVEPKVDAVIFRQNTEGLYSGVEWTDPPQELRRALDLHPKMAKYAETSGEDLAVTRGAIGLAEAQMASYAAMPYEIDMDRLIAGGLVHDIGKILEMDRDADGSYSKSRSGRCARHPISGAILAAKAGMPDEIVNIIACHAEEGQGRPQVVETVLIHQADFAAFNPLAMMAENLLIK